MSCLPRVEERSEWLELECYKFYFLLRAIFYVVLVSIGLKGSGGGCETCFDWLASLLLIRGAILLLRLLLSYSYPSI